MKKKITSLVLALALVASLNATFVAAADVDTAPSILDMTDYYSVVSTSEWTVMDRAERAAACQFSNEEIDAMSTEELLFAVLDYPFMIDLFAFNSYREGFLHVYSEFPALAALTAREDYSDVLVSIYKEMPVASASNQDDEEMCDNILNLSILEILIAQPEMTSCLPDATIGEIGQIADDKCSEKLSEQAINGGNVTTFYDAVNESPDSAMAVAARATATVYTPKRTPVTVIDNYGITDWTSSEKNSINAQYAISYPGAVRISDPSKRYNCHSYAWYSNTFSNYYWMMDPSPYMTDGSYHIGFGTNTRFKAYWATDSHSANIASITNNVVTFESKWGSAGVYRHTATNCPYTGSYQFWDRA